MIVQWLIPSVLWTAVLILVLVRPLRSERSILWAAVLIACAMTLAVDEIFLPLDMLAGQRNYVVLVANALMVVGVYYLARALRRGHGFVGRSARFLLGPLSMIICLAVMVILFPMIRSDGSTTTFMRSLGDQPAAAAYSCIQYAYLGMIMASLIGLAYSHSKTATGLIRFLTLVLLCGSVSGVILCSSVIAQDIAHVVGNIELRQQIGLVYKVASPLTFILMFVGVAGTPSASRAISIRHTLQARRFIHALTPAWQWARTVRPGLVRTNTDPRSREDSEALLHRQIVEIRDALLETEEGDGVLDDRVRRTLDAAEAHLLNLRSRPEQNSLRTRN
jgi:hypothetical protein